MSKIDRFKEVREDYIKREETDYAKSSEHYEGGIKGVSSRKFHKKEERASKFEKCRNFYSGGPN